MRLILTAILILSFVANAEARGRRSHGGAVPQTAPTVPSAPQDVGEVCKALDKVNALRASKGLPPYKLCTELQRAAEECAKHRARYRISGHTASDLNFAAPGWATCAGCAAWPRGSGFGSCAIYDNYEYAGAATVCGADGIEYHQLILR